MTTRGGKICALGIILATLAWALLAYRMFAGAPTVTARDGRQAIVLAPSERALILTEMRAFLGGTQRITHALGVRDMKTVAAAARALGRAATHEAPPELIAKLPLPFKQLGFSVHDDFDQIALDAESFGDPQHTLEQLDGVMQKCVACHATYQFQTQTRP
jgi:hypothetical protein